MSVIQVYVRIENIGFKTQVQVRIEEERKSSSRLDDGERKRDICNINMKSKSESFESNHNIKFQIQVAATNSFHHIPYKLRK